MPVDILDQPHGGILSTVVQYLSSGKRCDVEELTKIMTGSNEGEKYFKRNVLDLLEALNFIRISGAEIYLESCPILSKWQGENLNSFETYFKVQLLSKIVTSNEAHIRYFGEVLRRIFDVDVSFDKTYLEQMIREARVSVGIPVSSGEELGGKVDFCIQFLRYFPLLYKIGKDFMTKIPQTILVPIFSLAITDIGKSSIKLYSELLEYIDKKYLPVLNRREDRILKVIHRTMNNPSFIDLFKIGYVSDGGRIVTLNNKNYNAVWVK